MLHDKLQNAFAHIEPSGDFADRTLDRMDTARPENIAVSKRRLAVLGLATIFCLTVAVGLPFLLNARRAAVIAPGASQSIVSRWPRPTGPVAFADLDLPPADGLDFSDETFGAGAASTSEACWAAVNNATLMGSANLVVEGTVEEVRFNHYAYDEIDGTQSSQQDSIVYAIRVGKVYGARHESVDVQTGDLVITENLLYSTTSASLDPIGQRLQMGHRYILVIDRESQNIVGDTFGGPAFFTKESRYYLSGIPGLPMPIALTQDGGYLFFAQNGVNLNYGWSDLVNSDSICVTMPEEVLEPVKSNMRLRYGPGFEEDFQKLVNRKLLLNDE